VSVSLKRGGFDGTALRLDRSFYHSNARSWIMRLGATYGVLLADGNTRPEKFCASAKELKANKDVPNVWQ
jgi:hypothetical protein